MRHVLIVCYDFPWISNAGVLRAYQFAKNLPAFGWHPVILTAQSRTIARVDDVELSDGPLSCPKFTARESEWLRFTGSRPIMDHGRTRTPRQNSAPLQAFRHRAARLAVPDGKIGWLPSALKHGMQVAREYPLSACLSISPRPTAHLVAWRLSRRLKIPWVEDFALPWSDAYWLAGRWRAAQWLDEKLQAKMVRSAQIITVAYPEIGRNLGSRCGAEVAQKVAVVPTGYDDDLFAQPAPETARKFTVIYPGNHFCEPGRHGETFLDAIDDWIGRDPSLEGQVEFIFAGKPDETLLRRRDRLTYRSVIRLEPFMSHRDCVQAILSSHACVVNTVGNRIPAKVYECMRARKPILALTQPDSDLGTLLWDYPAAIAVAPRNIAALGDALQSFYRRRLAGNRTTSDAHRCVMDYSSRSSAAMLGRVLDKLANRAGPARKSMG